MTAGDWTTWELEHDDPDQRKRMLSAEKAECTPLSIDLSASSGQFSGSHGVYNTTLVSCQCGDFTRRRKPCKHMYRLAIQLGLHEGKASSDLTKVKAPPPKDSYTLAELAEKLESVPEESQVIFKQYLHGLFYTSRAKVVAYPPCEAIASLVEFGLFAQCELLPDAYISVDLRSLLSAAGISGFRKNAGLQTLISWCKENEPVVKNVILDNLQVVTITPRSEKYARKIYTYLTRKFDVDQYYDAHMILRYTPKGAESQLSFTIDSNGTKFRKSSLAFPNDEVTELLNKYGANRCDGWDEEKGTGG